MFCRRRFVQGGVACLGVAMQRTYAGLWRRVPSDTVEVKTRFGVLRGASEKGVVSFKGVPYAGPADGTGRFLKAPPLQPWTGTRDALKLGPVPRQNLIRSENSLISLFPARASDCHTRTEPSIPRGVPRRSVPSAHM